MALAAIFVYSLARGEETEHYKIKQPIRQKSPLFDRQFLKNAVLTSPFLGILIPIPA